jgi:hypothetical protein
MVVYWMLMMFKAEMQLVYIHVAALRRVAYEFISPCQYGRA